MNNEQNRSKSILAAQPVAAAAEVPTEIAKALGLWEPVSMICAVKAIEALRAPAAPVAEQAGLATWQGAADWLRNNAYLYPNLATICDAMVAASPVAAPVAATEQAIPKGRYWAIPEGDLLGLLSSDIGAAYVDPVAAAARCKVRIHPLATPADAGAALIPTTGNAQIDSFLADYEIRADEGIYSLTAHDRWVIANFLIELDEEVPFLGRLPAPAAPVTASDELLAECRAVFDLMLEGCNDQEFGDFQNGHGETIGPRMDALHAKLRGQSPAPVTAEPVAWMTPTEYQHAAFTTIKSTADQWADYGYQVTPVYAAPVSTQPAAQVPSRDSEIAEVLKEARRDLSHVEMYLEEIDAPPTIRNRTIDIRSSLQNLAALKGQPAASLPATSSEAAPVDRDSVLEEVARLVESKEDGIWANTCGQSIRALKASAATAGGAK